MTGRRSERTRPGPRRKHLLALVGLVAMIVPAGTALTTTPVASAEPQPGEDRMALSLQRKFERSDGAPQDFWVSFDAAADTSAAREIDDWAERGQYVVDRLRAEADEAQADTIEDLDSAGATYTAYWITNAIRVEDGDYLLAQQLASDPAVDSVFAPVRYEEPKPIDPRATAKRLGPDAVASVEWGVSNVKADQVWEQYGVRGDGIVVASIDSGVQFDHPALVETYRGNNGDGTFSNDYNWFDAAGSGSTYPTDTNGHGTHTMGTMVGDDGAANRVGVAPGATWIAANGCCPSDQALIDSAQWMLAPTRIDGTDPDPAMRPNIVNNSWGSTTPSNDPFMEDVLTGWADAGIFGVWANGNLGPGCDTASAPGSRTLNYSVGAYDSTNTVAEFSSRGEGQDGDTKPNLSAPGANVRSSIPGNGYAVFNGTSMATPHVAGAIALLWSADPSLIGNLATTRQLLDDTATDTDDTTCGGTADDNNVYGEGRLDALALVQTTDHGDLGTISGTVTHEETGDPVAGARVDLAAGDLLRSTRTETDGTYTTNIPAGDYTATVSSFGYEPATVNLTVTAGQTTTTDIQLAAVEGFSVTGKVVDQRTGRGIPGATVTLAGSRYATETEADGSFAVPNVPGPRRYVATVDGGGCTRTTHRGVLVDQDLVLATIELTRYVDRPQDVGWGWGPPSGMTCHLEPTRWIAGDTPIDTPALKSHTKVRMPFAFTYFGRQYRDLLVDRRGVASFWLGEDWIPGSDEEYLLYGMWPYREGHLFDDQSAMFSRTRGKAPNRTFTVEWRDVSRLNAPDVRYSFELTLHENGDFVYAYKDIDDDKLLERGYSAEVGLQDRGPDLNLTYRTKFVYSAFETVLDNDRQVHFSLPPNGFVQGRVVAKSSGAPIANADVDLIDRFGNPVERLHTGPEGGYRAQLMVGQPYSIRVMAPPGFTVPPATKVRLTRDRQVLRLDTALRSGRIAIDRTQVTLRPGEATTLRLRNTGSTALRWRSTTLVPDPTRPPSGTEIRTGLTDLGIQVGVEEVDGSLWVSAADFRKTLWWVLAETTSDGQPTGATISPDDIAETTGVPVERLAAGDLAWVPSRGWLCMIFSAGGIDDIVCVDPDTSAVKAVVRTGFAGDILPRGLAYDPATDRFFVLASGPHSGPWRKIRTLTGVEHPETGTILNTCFDSVSGGGLAWDPARRSLWTQSHRDLRQLDPVTCAERSSVSPSYSTGAPFDGLDIDRHGNAVSTFKYSDRVTEITLTDPAPRPLRWLRVSKLSGSLAPKQAQQLRISADWAKVPDGVTRAQLVLYGNGGPRTKVTIPITLRR